MEMIPNKKLVKVGDREFFIKKFSIVQGSRFIKWIIKAAASNKDEISGLKDKFNDSKSNGEDLLSIINILNEDMIIELISICLDTTDTDFVKNNLSLDDTFSVISDIVEINDIGGLIKNLNRTVKTLTDKIQTPETK